MKLLRPLILASASPRRAELLNQIALPFTIRVSHIVEPPPVAGGDLTIWMQQTAVLKAQATAMQLSSTPCLVLGADTVVVLPDESSADFPLLHGNPARVLGKPGNAQKARQMLQMLSGREHSVLSAFALVSHPEGTTITDVVETRVRFRRLSEEEIEGYVATGEPLDKAGAYGIQGRGAVLIDGILGDYYTVVGLPLTRLWECLAPWRQK